MRYLVDTSIWVAHLRGDEAVSTRLVPLVDAGHVVTCEPIVMELLAGAKPGTVERLERMLDSMPSLSVEPHLDFRVAARLLRQARASGVTIRSSVDALIAAIALRTDDVTVVHNDVDYVRIRELVPLPVARWA